MTTATKIISIKRGTAAKLQDVEKRVLEITGYAPAELFDMKLSIGLRFAEQFTRSFISNRQYIYQNLTENPDWNFWNWWQLKWSQDDALMLQVDENFSNSYELKKEAMIGEDALTKDLYWMIQQYTDLV